MYDYGGNSVYTIDVQAIVPGFVVTGVAADPSYQGIVFVSSSSSVVAMGVPFLINEDNSTQSYVIFNLPIAVSGF